MNWSLSDSSTSLAESYQLKSSHDQYAALNYKMSLTGTYKVKANGRKCEKCTQANCERCIGPGENDCTQCQEDWYLEIKKPKRGSGQCKEKAELVDLELIQDSYYRQAKDFQNVF